MGGCAAGRAAPGRGPQARRLPRHGQPQQGRPRRPHPDPRRFAADGDHDPRRARRDLRQILASPWREGPRGARRGTQPCRRARQRLQDRRHRGRREGARLRREEAGAAVRAARDGVPVRAAARELQVVYARSGRPLERAASPLPLRRQAQVRRRARRSGDQGDGNRRVYRGVAAVAHRSIQAGARRSRSPHRADARQPRPGDARTKTPRHQAERAFPRALRHRQAAQAAALGERRHRRAQLAPARQQPARGQAARPQAGGGGGQRLADHQPHAGARGDRAPRPPHHALGRTAQVRRRR